MKSSRISAMAFGAACLLVVSMGAGVRTRGQQPSNARPDSRLSLDTLCAGFISEAQIKTNLKVVGSGKELQSYPFAERDLLYVNKGVEQGVQTGGVYVIGRPLGAVKQPFSKKMLGYYVKELGLARIVAVQNKTSTVQVIASCDEIWLGDVLIPYEPPPDTYAAEVHKASGKPVLDMTPDSTATKGQIILSRGFHEYLATNDIVFLDLGASTGIHPGDSFTIYRTIGQKEGLTKYRDDKIYSDREGGYGSERYRGGDLPLDAPAERIDDVTMMRPDLPKKVVGQLVIVKVDGTTSVARIVQTNEEVNIGDLVQLNSN